MSPSLIPCSWNVTCEACPDLADKDQSVQDSALWLASTWLWAATGRQYGACPVTIRPSQSRWQPWAYQAYPVWPGQDPIVSGPFLFAGRWYNRGCGTACCGNRACAVVLRGPVASIDEVWVNGELVMPSSYRVDITNGTYLLVRVDGECWPVCQNFEREPDQDGTFEVTYHLGRALPEALAIATALLACEYAKVLTGGKCVLPARMTRISRQGVEVEVDPPSSDEGKSGIKAVDDVVAALNPSKRQRPPLLLSPDLPEMCDRMTIIGVGGS